MAAYINNIPLPPRVMTQAEQTLLLKITGQHKSGFRDYIIISMALNTGLREHEIAALNVGDILTTKGKTRHRVFLKTFKRSAKRPALQEIILSESMRLKLTKFISYKKQLSESLSPNEPLFISRKKNRLSKRQLRNMLKKWQEHAGFEKPYTFHTLRHCACSAFYQATKDIRLTQRFARHKSVTTTEQYAHTSLEDLVKAVQKLPY